MFTSPSQIIFTVFGVDIYYYGVIMAFAIAVSTLIADMLGTKFFDLKKDTIIDLAPYLIIFGLIGARLYYCVMDAQFYLRFPSEIFAIRHGGISIHGAILGGLAGLYIFSLRHKISFKKLSDITVIGLAFGQSIGRWGNFFNSEAYGLPTDLPWKFYIAPQYRIIPYQQYEYFHPTFLYESIMDFILFVILVLILKFNKNRKEGNIALYYLIFYSCIRLVVESLRIDSVKYIHGIPVAIVMSVCIILVAVLLLILNNIKKREY